MNSNSCGDLDRIISSWPGVGRRPEKTQIVFSVAATNFCWLSPRTGMVQLRPCLGPKCVTRRLERVGNEVKVIHQETGRIDAVYKDPSRKLIERLSYPGFKCSNMSRNEALDLIRQAYETVRRRPNVSDTFGGVASVANATTRGRGFASPAKDDLVKAYHELYQMHPHDLLPLEGALPIELRPKWRDGYRIVMTMILSGRKGDMSLGECLGQLFKRHPNFESLRNLGKHQIKQLLGKKEDRGIGLGNTDPDGGGNGARLWSFLRCYFGPWQETVTPENIQALYQERGFRAKFVKTLEAYYLGKQDVLPLDGPAFRALRISGLYEYDSNIDEVREDIEDKLRSESGVSLIDFHEMLRFIEQFSGKGERGRNNIIIGWNAWRLLCSKERDKITKDWKWIHERLVKDESIARELWYFYRKVADS